MEKEKLPPIPTPASQRWREFRIRVLPFLVFFVVLSGVVSLWKNFVQPVGIVGLAETNAVSWNFEQKGLIIVSKDGLDDEFWNQPFGAATPLADVGDAAAVTAYFMRGRALHH